MISKTPPIWIFESVSFCSLDTCSEARLSAFKRLSQVSPWHDGYHRAANVSPSSIFSDSVRLVSAQTQQPHLCHSDAQGPHCSAAIFMPTTHQLCRAHRFVWPDTAKKVSAKCVCAWPSLCPPPLHAVCAVCRTCPQSPTASLRALAVPFKSAFGDTFALLFANFFNRWKKLGVKISFYPCVCTPNHKDLEASSKD